MRTCFFMGMLGICGVVLWLLYVPPMHSTVLSLDPANRSERESTTSARSKGTVYVVIAPECPISNSYLPKLNRLHVDLREHGMELIGVVPSVAASRQSIDAFQRKFSVGFPIVPDAQQSLCRDLNATHTPQAILVNAAGTVVYSGRIDDRFTRIAGQQREVRHDSLQLAVGSFLNGESPEVSETEPVGCHIEFLHDSQGSVVQQHSDLSETTIVFTKHIAPIIYGHCTRCHRQGEAAPFSLLTYEDTVQHATQIRETVEQRLMPPWKPAANFGRFKNEHRLTESEIKTVTVWVQSGMPRGPDQAMPSPPEFPEGWQLGKPDLELIMPESFDVPAEGPDVYRHFVIPIGLTKNRLISAFEFRPGAPDVVHHATTFYDTTGQGRKLDEADPGPGYSRVGTPGFAVSGSLGGWGPGGLPNQLPIGMGRPLSKDADLILQVHYHPSGRKVKDQSRIGLYFASEWADRLVTEIMIANTDLVIPADAAYHHHRAEWTLPVDTILLDATPHMHVLGRRIQAVAYPPAGDAVPLIRIDDWDFYWQDSYAFEKPVELPAGTKIVLDCLFDNSSANPQNPSSPPRDVSWGDFSNDEMGICYFQATTRTIDDYELLNNSSKANFQSQWDEYIKRKESRESNANAAQ